MDAEAICKLNKYGHCRYGKYCNFIHVDEKCEVNECDSRNCPLRHPRDCRYVTRNKKCKFGDLCAFGHKTSGTPAAENV